MERLTLIAIFVALVFAHGLVSARLEQSVFTAPLLFTDASKCTLRLMKRVTALPGIDLYAKRIASLGREAPEHQGDAA